MDPINRRGLVYNIILIKKYNKFIKKMNNEASNITVVLVFIYKIIRNKVFSTSENEYSYLLGQFPFVLQ